MRVALVRPAVDRLHKFSKATECLALGYLASALRRAGHEAVILDAELHDWSYDETIREIEAVQAPVVGFTVTMNYFPARLVALLGRLRERGSTAIILVGGHAVSFYPGRILSAVSEVDGVVSGEGEGALVAIADSVESCRDWRDVPGVWARGDDGVIRGNTPRRIRVLSELPWPARDLTEEVIRRNGNVCISASRGCYARCTFCSVPRFYGLDRNVPYASGQWLARPVNDVVAEVQHVHDEYGAREILIVDDEFFGGGDAGHSRAIAVGHALAAAGRPVDLALS